MANYKVVDTEKLDAGLVATADAIRAKTKSEDSISWSSERGFADAIEEIKDKKVFSREDDVCFWDYEGTLVYSCSLAEAQTMTELPEPPDHSSDEIPLVFEEWNWTLEEINALQRKADVGAIYSPVDEKTHFSIRLTPVSGLLVTLAWSQYSSANRLITIDWGDGIIEDYNQGATGQTSCSHTYAEYGTYNCSINPNGAGWNPAGNSSLIPTPGNTILVDTVVFDKKADWSWPDSQGSNLLADANIEKCILPSGMTGITGIWPLPGMCYLKHLNIPRKMKTAMNMQNSSSLKRISYPAGLQNNGEYACSGWCAIEEIRLPLGFNFTSRFPFSGSHALKHIDLPESITVLTMRAFQNCYGIKELRIPAAVTQIDAEVFSGADILDYYFYSEIPPTLANTNAFAGIKKSTIIHVPSASLGTYQTATNWATFADYMVGDL